MRTKGTNDPFFPWLASRQHGLIARRQLVGAGYSPSTIDRLVKTGWLRVVHRGVFAIGGVELGERASAMAAVLACGDGAVAGEMTAAQLWGFSIRTPSTPCVITHTERGRKLGDIDSRRFRLSADERTTRYGIPVTTPARTIVDLAAQLPERDVRRVIERAQDVRRFHPKAIRHVTSRTPRRKGTPPLDALVTLYLPDRDNSRSHLERLFLKLLRDSGLPKPLVNERIAGRRRDFTWPDHRLVVETDGAAWHASPKAQRRDRRRDRELLLAGYRPARFTYEDVVYEPGEVAAELSLLLR